MKRSISLLAVGLLLLPVMAQAENKPVEYGEYQVSVKKMEIVEDKLTVTLDGFDNRVHLVNGQIEIPAYLYAMAEGTKYDNEQISCSFHDDIAEYVFSIPYDKIPDELYIYPLGDEAGAVLLWSAAEEEGSPFAEMAGVWHGTGTPKGGGPSIDLSVTVNEDGTGEYTFVQNGYTESYPFTLEAEGNKFSVEIPEDNLLGIVSCEGTYEVKNERELFLDITTTFANSRQYSYTAVCGKEMEEESAPAEEEAPAEAEEPAEAAAEEADAG